MVLDFCDVTVRVQFVPVLHTLFIYFLNLSLFHDIFKISVESRINSDDFICEGSFTCQSVKKLVKTVFCGF